MNEDFNAGPENHGDPDSGASLSVPGACDLDAARYLSNLEGFDLTEAQKIELLETLWSIMRTFVELGFKVDICARMFDGAPEFPLPALDAVSLRATASPSAVKGE